MSDDDFSDKLRAFAREFSESLERAAERIDKDEIAERIEASGEQVREFAQFAGQWLSDLLGSGQGADAPRRRPGGPHPLDTPTEEQGVALGALASGRWRVKPGTNELVSDDEAQEPGESLGLAGELRARDWITANGELTELGRAALRRWAEREEPAPGPEG